MLRWLDAEWRARSPAYDQSGTGVVVLVGPARSRSSLRTVHRSVSQSVRHLGPSLSRLEQQLRQCRDQSSRRSTRRTLRRAIARAQTPALRSLQAMSLPSAPARLPVQHGQQRASDQPPGLPRPSDRS